MSSLLPRCREKDGAKVDRLLVPAPGLSYLPHGLVVRRALPSLGTRGMAPAPY